MGGGGKLESKALKTQSFVVIGGFAAMIAMLAIVSSGQRLSPNATPQQALLFGVIAAMACCGSLLWTWLKLWPRAEVGQAPVPVPARTFLSNLIICLALAEFPAMLGFGVGAVLREYRIFFFGASLAVILLAILPAAVRYWSTVEEQPS
jgi:hypothetical protein